VRVLFVSKPICKPLHDGSQCLVRDVATHLVHAQPSVMGVKGAEYPFARDGREVEVLPVYLGRGSFAPSLGNNALALLHLLKDFRSDLWHFVFAPNPRTSSVLRNLRKVRRTPTLQTFASPPKNFEQVQELLFGDTIVVQSEWTRRRLLEQAKHLEIQVILPSAPKFVVPDDRAVGAMRQHLDLPELGKVVVYPGDLEFSQGSRYFAELIEALSDRHPDTAFVYACRAKTSAAAGVQATLERRLRGRNVRFAGELKSLLPLLRLATLVVFPTDSAFGKVDIPIALLEAIRLEVPVLSFDFGPLVELQGTVQVPLGNTAALVGAAEALLSDSNHRLAVGGAQCDFIRRELEPERAAGRYEQLYRELVQVG
jgi:glycosyltransferase involved in cell wall biosynthesis